MSYARPLRTDRAGFTLIEVALAIFIMGLLLAGVVLPLRAQLEVRMIDETQRLLDEAREALLGYAAANGHFPCPATAASNGYEPASAQANRDADPEITPTCTGGYSGFLPAAELGLANLDPQGYAVDGWGTADNRIRYAVTNAAPDLVVDAFVVEGGMQTAGLELLASVPLLHVCASSAGIVPGVNCGAVASNTITDRAAVVIWSVGPNARTGGTSADEAENPNPNNPGLGDNLFVSRPRSAGAGLEFDDLVVWIPLPIIVNRLVAAGHLP